MYRELVKEAGLTDGEAKVYIALLELGQSTTGPIIEKSKIARSFIYNILEKLIEKGLISYVVREGTRYYIASDPTRILDYIEKRKNKLEQSKEKIKKLIPQLKSRDKDTITDIQVYEGFRGLQTCFEHYHQICKKGDDVLCFGVIPHQDPKYHEYWEQDHKKRAKKGITNRMLFNKGTDPKILKNRNSFKGCEARYMDSDIKTPAWLLMYKDTTQIYLQDKKKPIVIEIVNHQIAETFKAYFEDYWKRTKKF